MISLLKKEINSFFSSIMGYIILVVFLLSSGLFIWVFPETSVLDYGYANLDSLFGMAPWLFMFLIPAVTMRSFSDEFKSGTIELLYTRPITDLQIVLAKYFATLFLVVISLIPTLLYYYTIHQLSNPIGNVDHGAIWGSYLGLIMLGGTFVSIGVFSSSLTDNQIIAFIISMFLCFFVYLGFDYLSKLSLFVGELDSVILSLGIDEHYKSISRGVLDSRDVVYFISVILLFILFAKTSLESRKW